MVGWVRWIPWCFRGKLKNPKNGFPENPCDENGKIFSLKNIVLT
jgi:hypothetical protein